jgi:hypothetical protein
LKEPSNTKGLAVDPVWAGRRSGSERCARRLTIGLRVTPDERELLRRLAETAGARGVADYVRRATSGGGDLRVKSAREASSRSRPPFER